MHHGTSALSMNGASSSDLNVLLYAQAQDNVENVEKYVEIYRQKCRKGRTNGKHTKHLFKQYIV